MPKKILSKQATPVKPYSDILKEWQNIQSLEMKQRYKAMRGVAGDICHAYKGVGVDAAKLRFYMDVLSQINRIHHIPRCRTTLSKITALWLNLTGNANAKIIKKIATKINVETDTIAIGEPSNFNEIAAAYENYTEQNVLHLINQGKLFIFDTDGEPEQSIQIRIVDSLMPVLSEKEYKCVLNSTETAVIRIPSGTLTVADAHFLDAEKYRFSTQIEPGHYKVCVYHFFIRSKVDSFYIVLCKTDEDAKNNLTRLPELG